MTQREIARLAMKVLAVYYGLQSLPVLQNAVAQLSQTFAFISRGNTWGWQTFLFQLPIAFLPFVQILIAIWLWKRAGLVAVWICSQDLQDEEDEPEVVRVPAELDAVQAVVLSSLGIWVMLTVLPEVMSMLLSFVFNLMAAPSNAFEYAGRGVTDKIWFWIPQVVLGIWLIFGASGIVQTLAKFRRRATPAEERPTSTT
jgi:hypothetical protein